MPASPSTRTILRMSFAAAFQALTRTGHSSARPMRLASSKGAWAYHSPVGAGRTFAASASIRRPSASKALDGSQPVSRSMAARYSASRARAAPRSPARYLRFDRQPGRLLGESVECEPAVGPLRRFPPAALVHGVASERGEDAGVSPDEAGPGLRNPLIELWCVSGGESGEKPGNLDRRSGFGIRLRQAQELGHIAAHRLGQPDHPSIGVHQASEGVTQLLQRLAQ